MPVKRIESESQDHQSENDRQTGVKMIFQFVKIINKLLQIVLSTCLFMWKIILKNV